MKVILSVRNGVPVLTNEYGQVLGNVQSMAMSITPSRMTMNVTFNDMPKSSDNSVTKVEHNPVEFKMNEFGPIELELDLDEKYFPIIDVETFDHVRKFNTVGRPDYKRYGGRPMFTR